VSNDTSFRNEPWNIITIDRLPPGATIEKAFLVWAILNNTSVPSTIMVNGVFFNGVLAVLMLIIVGVLAIAMFSMQM